MTDYRPLAIIIIYNELWRANSCSLTPYTDGANQHNRSWKWFSILPSWAEWEQTPAASFRLHTIMCRLRYTVHVWLIPIETRPIHGESCEILWALYVALCRCRSQFKKLHSWAIAAWHRCQPWKQLDWLLNCEHSNSFWQPLGTRAALSFLKISEKFNYIVCETKLREHESWGEKDRERHRNWCA